MIKTPRKQIQFLIQHFSSLDNNPQEKFDLPPPLPAHRNFKRCGLLGIKVGMMGLWDKWGQRHPTSVVLVFSFFVELIFR